MLGRSHLLGIVEGEHRRESAYHNILPVVPIEDLDMADRRVAEWTRLAELEPTDQTEVIVWMATRQCCGGLGYLVEADHARILGCCAFSS